MKILFFPSDLDGKIGHLDRCYSLAQYANLYKQECAFVVHHRKNIKFFNSDYKIFHVSIENILQKMCKSIVTSITNHNPLYLTIPNLNYQIIDDGLTNQKIIKKIIEDYTGIIKEFRPDLIISDRNFISGIVAKLYKIPIVQLVNASFYPVRPQFIWWEPIPLEVKSPNIGAIFNPVLEDIHLQPIEHADDLLQGDICFIPSIPEIEPADINSNTYYIGPLLVKRSRSELPQWFEKNGQPLIVVTIGENGESGFYREIYDTLIAAFQHEQFQVLICTKNKYFHKNLDNGSNITFQKWSPGADFMNVADLIIFHGDYTTMMETVQAGKPSIVIPFHSEQESNGRRLQNIGCSLICKISDSPAEVVEKSWKFGKYTYLANHSYDLTVTKLQNLTKQILTTDHFEKNARRVRNECQRYQGAARAFAIISRYFSMN